MNVCHTCRRHVRESECPFCGGSQLRPTTPRTLNTGGVSRAQLVATAALIGVVAGTAELGCGSETVVVTCPGETVPSTDGDAAVDGGDASKKDANAVGELDAGITDFDAAGTAIYGAAPF